MLKEFNQAFGKTPSLFQERTAFLNRADHLLTLVRPRVGSYDDFFKSVCFELGIRPSDYKMAKSENGSLFMNLGTVAANDFHRMVEILIAAVKTAKTDPPLHSFIDQSIRSIMDRATAALDVSYNSGLFYPAGEPLLDHDLINHSLRVLVAYPAEDRDLRLALDHYRAGKKDGIIETCYRCLEGLTRQVLSNGKTLINNKPELLRNLGLTDPWNSMLAAYIDFGNDYGRHASADRHNTSGAEVEAYLYMTCLLARLLVKTK